MRIERKVVGMLFMAFSVFFQSSCGDSSGDENSLQYFNELDVTFEGARYQYFVTQAIERNNYNTFNISSATAFDEHWPSTYPSLRFDIKIDRFVNIGGIPEETTFDFSGFQSDMIINFSLTVNKLIDAGQPPQLYSLNLGPEGQLSSSGKMIVHTFRYSNDFVADNSGKFNDAMRYDIEVEDIVLNKSTNTNVSDLYPNTITVRYAKFCKLNGSCGIKKAPFNPVGEYTGSPITVISTGCIDSADNGPFTLQSSVLNVLELSGGNFKGSIRSQDMVEGFAVVATQTLTGSVDNNGSIVGDFTDNFRIDGGTVSEGGGTFTGNVNENKIQLVLNGQDTSGDTCSWSASNTYVK